MLLTIGAFYLEPGIEFKISYRVFQVVRETLVENVMVPYGLLERDSATHLSLMICTKKACVEPKAKGPDKDPRTKTVTWGLWLPYDEISKQPDQRAAFVRAVFSALPVVFETYGIEPIVFRALALEVLGRVSGDEYAYRPKNKA